MDFEEGSYEVQEEGYQVPDVPHLEIMFDAVEDTAFQAIDGNECYPLSAAQRYAQGALHAAGIYTAAQVSGNEGFLSSIGNGLKAMWDYIVKTFKAIWSFFFERDNAKEAEAAKDKIDETTDNLKSAASGTQTEEQADAQINALVATAKAEGEDDSAVKAVVDDLAEARKGGLSEKRAAIKKALTALPKLSKKAHQKLEASVQNAINGKRGFISLTKDTSQGSSLGDGHAAVVVLKALQADVAKQVAAENAMIALLQGALKITNASNAVNLGNQIKTNIDSLKKLCDNFKAQKAKVQELINTTEKASNTAKDAKDKTALKAELDGLRKVVNLATKVAKLTSINYVRLGTVNKDLSKVLGL